MAGEHPPSCQAPADWSGDEIPAALDLERKGLQMSGWGLAMGSPSFKQDRSVWKDGHAELIIQYYSPIHSHLFSLWFHYNYLKCKKSSCSLSSFVSADPPLPAERPTKLGHVSPHLTNHLHRHLRWHRNIAKEQVPWLQRLLAWACATTRYEAKQNSVHWPCTTSKRTSFYRRTTTRAEAEETLQFRFHMLL